MGLHKLGLAMKQQAWSQANEDGLSPTQGQIVAALSLEGPLSGSELAARLGLTLPTISDSVRVLAEKDVVENRAIRVMPSQPRLADGAWTRPVEEGERVAGLPVRGGHRPDRGRTGSRPQGGREDNPIAPAERAHSDGSNVCVMQVLPAARPRRSDAASCAFVDAPMADRHLRIECGEHEEALTSQRDDAWERFVRD